MLKNNTNSKKGSSKNSAADPRNPKPRRAYTHRQWEIAVKNGELVEVQCSTPGCNKTFHLHYTKAEKVKSGEGEAQCYRCDLAEKFPDSQVAKTHAQQIGAMVKEAITEVMTKPSAETKVEVDWESVDSLQQKIPEQLYAGICVLKELANDHSDIANTIIGEEAADNFMACMAGIRICRAALDQAEQLIKDELVDEYNHHQKVFMAIDAVIDWQIDPNWKG